jgi:7-cyano-7-deazaguanine reductase
MKKEIEASTLGRKTIYLDKYHPQLLYSISRRAQEKKIYGYDLWNLYEVSWLNNNGKAEVALGQVLYSVASPKIVESKSFKLYLNSFNNSRFESREAVCEIIRRDLTKLLESPVTVVLIPLDSKIEIIEPEGLSLDSQEPAEENWIIDPNKIITEKLFSNLFRSNCPITNQPDWASLVINYSGPSLSHKRLLHYLLSFRNHQDFHENSIEKLFEGIARFGKTHKLTIAGHYTRRGGLDINPLRSHEEVAEPILPTLTRFIRQ